MFEGFYKYTEQIVSFTEKEKAIIEGAFTFRQVPKKFKLTEEGKIARELYFINKGLVRLYYTKDGEEITGFIFKEHLFASSYDSLLRQTPSIQTLETLEDCELLVITAKALEELYEAIPKMQVLGRKVAEQRFINGQMILSSFILDSPEERYKKFVAQHGDLLLRVPHHIIASYLGITPVSMSRIRKRMSE
ncbi:MAG: Crp/Fnr family transcriptional regulator [Bacteroidetes bacterium]|nr:Crp/Fnr family transcriptional regulator [Bacteroidota bacterium]